MNVFPRALSSDVWIIGIAIARYIPRAFRTYAKRWEALV